MTSLSPELAQATQRFRVRRAPAVRPCRRTLTARREQAQEASLSASVTAMTDPGTGLAEARRLSCVCRDALSALRRSVDAFDLSLATEEALEPHAPAVLAAKEELRRMRVAHDGCVTC